MAIYRLWKIDELEPFMSLDETSDAQAVAAFSVKLGQALTLHDQGDAPIYRLDWKEANAERPTFTKRPPETAVWIVRG